MAFAIDLEWSEIRQRMESGEPLRYVSSEASGIPSLMPQHHLFLGRDLMGHGSYSEVFDAVVRGELVGIEDDSNEASHTKYELSLGE